ncbi:MAG: DNA-3-methyladenine glycosylase [Acidobacteria bacterium]|nr:DNA-3-methyladenine glycosylase [Acidobacteriota bacterium]
MLQPGSLIPPAFYLREPPEVARALLGCCLWREGVALRITEVEAYGGPEDSASHGRHGRTARNAPMWTEGGRVYMYLCYGIHRMLNIVTGEPGRCGAVLVRAAEPVAGLERVLGRRRMQEARPALLAGPGRVAQALDLDLGFSGQALFEAGGLELREGWPPMRIAAGPRVGVDFASPADRRRRWRFVEAGSPWQSAPSLGGVPRPRRVRNGDRRPPE